MKRREQLTGFYDHYSQALAEGDMLTECVTGAHVGTVRWSDELDGWAVSLSRQRQATEVPLEDLPLDNLYATASIYDTGNFYNEEW